MSTPEGKVKDIIKKLLKEYGAYYHMPVQNGMGSPTLDFIGCYRGRYFAIEAKAPDGVVTPRQMVTMETIRGAGGSTFVIRGGPDTLGWQYLKQWLDTILMHDTLSEGLPDAFRIFPDTATSMPL